MTKPARTGTAVVAAAICMGAFIGAHLIADAVDSGQRQLGQNILEPAYNGADGSAAYLLTPSGAPAPPAAQPVSPVYVIVYPADVAGIIGTVNCQHQPMDNCPDHGPAIAGLAESTEPAVYSGGVWGHDHMVTGPGVMSRGFAIARLPIVVLFTAASAAANHITTITQLNQAIADGDVVTIMLPAATFHGSSISEATYGRGTPVQPVAPLP